ncbi:MAG TPA: DNA methyltransferase [Candidatus Fermentibacter daniensis]|nr:DNA methyltransferase [Candidatus Fermentibacter daniensis]
MNKLFFGDCLDVLRNEIPDESVDLVYLDPPFNSSRDYNLLFKAPDGHKSEAQIEAFQDTWHWGEQAEREFRQLLVQPNTQTSELLASLRRFLGENDLMAYLTMMANRLLELHRSLRSTGSLYLHCDPSASHYLKVVLDAVFGPESFGNEISWLRSQPKSHTTINFPNCRDVILRYTKGNNPKFFKIYTAHDPEYLEKFYRFQDSDGRRYRLGDLTNPNKDRPNLTYEFLGVTRVWRWTKDRMQKALDEGRIVQSKPGSIPAFKRYLDDMRGQPISDNWSDIEHLHGSNSEALGYPTQKPQALLERIIEASSELGDVVMDPFCGCGTAVHAAQKLGRLWIGIDITHLAISLIEKRLTDAFPGIEFEVHGTPKDLEGARNLALRDKYQFQWWACSLVGAQPWQDKKKGADRGIDGIIYFQDEKGIPKKIIVSVKGGESVGRAMIADLKNSVEREKAQIGLFVTLAAPTKEMVKEALTAGFYESPNFKSGEYPKIQILTIEGLLNGTQCPRYPDLSLGVYTFKKASQESAAAEPSIDLFNQGSMSISRE